MGRQPTGWWDDRAKRYKARLGPISPRTGKPKPVVLKRADGSDIPHQGDKLEQVRTIPDVVEAIRRIVLARKADEQRNSGPTVGDVVDRFIAWHRTQKSAPQTVKDHVYRLTRFGRFVYGGVAYRLRPAASLELRDLSRFRKHLEERGNETGNIRIFYSSILACWRWAARPVEDREPERLIPSNPFEGLARPRRGRMRKKYVPPALAERLIEFAERRTPTREAKARRLEPRRILALKLIAWGGCRPFEAAGLQWPEIDWPERMIVLLPRSEGGRSKTRKGRRVDLRPEIIAELEVLKSDTEGDSLYVFGVQSQFREGPPTSRLLGRWFRVLRDDAIADGIPLDPKTTLYWFRHTWQTLGLEVASAERVAAAAGNSAAVLLSTYDQTQNREIRDVADRIDEARRKAKG